MAQQTKTITSESLESAYRALTPSQAGFTEDLMASNTIIPVLDLTSSAQGTTTPQYLQTALAFGSQTTFDARNSTVVVANSPGFYRIFATISGRTQSSGTDNCRFQLSDGLSTKIIYDVEFFPAPDANTDVVTVDFVVFLAAGESISAVSNSSQASIVGSVRQVATVNGDLVNPSGFTPQ